MFIVTATPRDPDERKKTPLERQLERDRAEAARFGFEQQEALKGDDDQEPIRRLMRLVGRID